MFTEDTRTAYNFLVELTEHTSTEYLDAYFPMEWSHNQIADAILRRHTADTLSKESPHGHDERHEEAGQTAEETQNTRQSKQ